MDNKSARDIREFSRVEVEMQAKIQAKGAEVAFKGTHNISMKGLYLAGNIDWPIGTECEVHLLLEGLTPPVDIKVKGRIQRVTEEGIAILFTEVTLEAYEHLSNLVLLNTKDTEKAERELDSHLGLKKKGSF